MFYVRMHYVFRFPMLILNYFNDTITTILSVVFVLEEMEIFQTVRKHFTVSYIKNEYFLVDSCSYKSTFYNQALKLKYLRMVNLIVCSGFSKKILVVVPRS